MAATRRLAAIMFTDMVGYTAGAQTDERSTLDLRMEQEELVRPEIVAHQGREVKSTGDGLLAEFDSALKATQCAINIQRRIHERNGKAGVTSIQLRIGIHLGDVEQQGSDIFGDAVNIAARIQPVAPPGGICLSGAVREQVWNKIPDSIEKLPSTALKGIRVPMELYQVLLPWTELRRSSPGGESARLAVLPFANMSPDPADLYFADGLTEELITVLSQFRDLRVIARTSIMQYKSTAKGVAEIGKELGVGSVLEGSVRRAGNRLRITAQLIDVTTQEHVWAKSYDRELDDVFRIQAEIAKQVADALMVELRPSEKTQLKSRQSVRPDSYLAYLKGRAIALESDRASLEAARRQFELAISLDPNNAGAHAGLAQALRLLGIWYTDSVPTDWVELVERSVARALELDPDLADAHEALSMVLWRAQDYPGMERELRTAILLNPSYALAHWSYANLLEFFGRTDEALHEFQLAEALDPLWTNNLLGLAWLQIVLGRLDDAWSTLQKLGALAEDWAEYHSVLGMFYFANADSEGTLREQQRAYELETDPRTKSMYLAWYYLRAGEVDKLRALLNAEEDLPEFGQNPTNVGIIYAELGDLDQCFRWLDKARRSHNLPLMLISINPLYQKLRADPRYSALLKEMNVN